MNSLRAAKIVRVKYDLGLWRLETCRGSVLSLILIASPQYSQPFMNCERKLFENLVTASLRDTARKAFNHRKPLNQRSALRQLISSFDKTCGMSARGKWKREWNGISCFAERREILLKSCWRRIGNNNEFKLSTRLQRNERAPKIKRLTNKKKSYETIRGEIGVAKKLVSRKHNRPADCARTNWPLDVWWTWRVARYSSASRRSNQGGFSYMKHPTCRSWWRPTLDSHRSLAYSCACLFAFYVSPELVLLYRLIQNSLKHLKSKIFIHATRSFVS